MTHLNQQQNLIQSVEKTGVDRLDIDKLKSLPTNLSNLKGKVDKLDTASQKLLHFIQVN